MRIVQISTFPPSLQGGQEAVVYYLSRELAANGHKVTVISSTNGKNLKRRPHGNLQTIHIPSFQFGPRLVIPRSLSSILCLIQEADVVHVHSPDVSFAFEIGLLSKVQRTPTVTSILCYLDSFKHPRLPVKLSALLIEGSVGILGKMSEAVHVKNIGDYAKLSRLCNHVTYIPDGIPSTFFETPRDPSLFNSKFGIENEPIVLYVGRLHHLKGPQVLIESFKYVLSEQPNALLIIIGPGNSYRRSLGNLVRELDLEEYVVLAGISSEEEKISAYDAANVVVIPSCSDMVEAFSLVASEAWSRGKPVVASRVGALRYRVKPGVNGYLAEPNNPRDLAEKILRASGMKVKTIPSDVCMWKDVCQRFEQLYEDVVASSVKNRFF